MYHVYEEWRCIFCGINNLDADIYGPATCESRGPMTYTTESGEMEITGEVLDSLKTHIESSIPDWLGQAEFIFNYSRLKGAVEVTTYFDFQRTNWVKISANKTSDGPIDVRCGMRSDWEFSETLFEDGIDSVSEFVSRTLFAQIYADLSDLVLSPTDGDSADPLLHYGDRARFLPRDEARKMLLTGVEYFAPRIAEGSSFREEDWYREWEAKQVATD